MPILGACANSADPVQSPKNAASDRNIQCLLTVIYMQNTVKVKIFPKTTNKLIQIIRIDH